MRKELYFAVRALLVLALGVAVQANAATVSRSFSGNDCSGYFGQGFDSCTVFVNSGGEDIELSPVIAKYGGDLTVSETNGTVFPSIDGTEFSFSNTTTDNKTGTWTYTQGAGDPGVRYWATKAGPDFLLFWEVDDAAVAGGGACDVTDVYTLACLQEALVVTESDWTTPDNKELSHITFYDTSVTPTGGEIPIPAAVWLFGSGLGLLGWMRRRP